MADGASPRRDPSPPTPLPQGARGEREGGGTGHECFTGHRRANIRSGHFLMKRDRPSVRPGRDLNGRRRIASAGPSPPTPLPQGARGKERGVGRDTLLHPAHTGKYPVRTLLNEPDRAGRDLIPGRRRRTRIPYHQVTKDTENPNRLNGIYLVSLVPWW